MNKMMRTVMRALGLAARKGLRALPVAAVMGLSALPAFAATKTVTWSLPADWEGNVELDQICEPVGAPSVAYYNALIEVPASATNFVITASDVAYRASELGRPAPVLEPSIVGEPSHAPVEDAALYAGIYPSDVFEKGEPWEMNGKTVLPVRIKVYRWNGPANKVEALESLKLSIACESPRATLKLKTSAVPTTKVDYIVISPHNYVSYWNKFVEYRRTTHTSMTFQVVDANDIYNTYSGHDDALKIHHFIEAMYKLGTRYILLGAGAQHTSYNNQSMIPTRICVTYNGNTQSCDYYYCVLDYKGGKEVWDYNGDQIYLASKNPNGGYYTDATSQFSWQGSMMVHRFPARDSISMGGKTKTAQQQIEGYVEKLKRAEQGLFAGRFSQAALGHQRSVSSDTAQGNTSEDCTMEREFYDHGANIFAPVHGSAITSIELDTRARVYNYMTVNRPIGYNKCVLQFYYKNGEDANAFYGRNFDAMIINAHGSPEVVEPINREGLWKATGLSLFHIMCCPCHAGNPCDGGNNVVSIGEAGVVNPDGGALVSYSNSSSGWYSSRDTMSQKIEVNLLRSLYGHLSGKGFQDAGTARLYAQNNYGTPSPRNANGQCIANGMAYGDPLVKLSPIYSRVVDPDGTWHRGDQLSTPSEQEFASGLTINATGGNQTITFTNAVGAANLTINGTSGKTLTFAASGNGKFTVANKVTVGNGMTLNWDVPGGFGRNGIQFSAGGNLRLRAGGYYGIEFQGMNSLNVAPPANTTAIVDFDSKGYFRDTKTGPISVTGQGETVFRSRQAGIFSTSLNIPVTGGTLTLETPCVGGSGAQSSTTPLFTVSNATLAVRSNPNWTPECFSRRVAFYDGSLKSSFDKFYLGPNVSNYPGLDIIVDGSNNNFIGNNLIRLNGQLRIHSNNGGKLNVTATLANGSGTGSICIKNGVKLRLAGVNTFTGGITVESGARLIVADPSALSSGTLTVRAGGVLEVETMPLKNVRQIVIEDSAKLVVHGQGQLFNPNTTSWRAGSGMEIYSTDGTTETKVDAIITAEGAFFNPAAALTWKEGTSLNWVNNASVLAWTKNGTDAGFQDGQAVYIKDTTTGANKITIPVSGAVNPSLVAFNNLNTPIEFTAVNGGTINSDSISTIGETDFKTPVTANGRFSTGGKTTLNTLTTKSLNVPSGGAINVTGSVTAGQETITIVRFYCTETIRYGHCIAGEAEYPMEISEYRCYSDASGSTLQFFPVGSVITDSKGNSVKITGINGSAYVFGEESGDTTLKNLFDGSTSTTHPVKTGTSGPWWIQVTMPTPIPMFKVFQFGTGPGHRSSNWIYSNIYGDHPTGNPYKWQVQAGNSTDKLTTVINMTTDNESKLSWTAKYTASALPSSSSAVVQSGGTLYLNGTYNIPLTINAGATLAVTNDSKLTFGAAKTLPTGTYSMTVDAKSAKKSSTYFQVTSGGGFSSVWQVQTADDVAAKIQDSNLWIATEGVMPPPYSRSVTGDGATVSWNTSEWRGKDDVAFSDVWGSVITKQSGTATLNVLGTNLTMSVDCAVNLDTLKVTTPTNCFPETLTVNLASGGSTGISALDFRDFNGKVIWNPALASWGTHVYVGTNDVTIASMTSGKGNLQVGAGGRATVPEKFAGYDVDKDALVRFTGTHSFAMGDIPTKGYLSFKNTTLSGSFQNSLIKYVVEKDDALTFTGDANNYNARMSSSFDIRGGSVTINSNGASTWFGINGETSFRQTNGTFKCTANDTSMSASNSGFLVGYSASSSDNFEFDISGGRFEIPNTYINFYGPVSFNLTTNGVVQAKGVFRGSNKGTINVNSGTAFELGTIGLVAGACDFNLYGGTLAGFENGAHTRSTVNLVGVGTLAAKANTTFTIDAGTINADGATLNIGNADYTGTVKLEDIPGGITNITVTAGTWDMGEFRPTNTVPVSVLTGKIAAQLTDDELREAAEGGFKLIKTSLPDGAEIEDRVAVVTRGGVAVEAMGSVRNGYIYIGVDYVYPLYATVVGDGLLGDQPLPATVGGDTLGAPLAWSSLDWHDAIGMPFKGDWADVESAVLSNELADVTLVVTNAFDTALTVINTGNLTLTRAAEGVSPYLDTLDDSQSTGKTTIGFTANNVTAGAETVIKHVGSGTLTLAAGKCAALWNNLDWPSAKISGFSGTAKIKYVGDTAQTSIKYAGATNYGTHGVVSYAQEYNLSDVLRFDYTVTREFADGLNLTVERLMNGNQKNNSQTFYQTGGKILVTGSGDILGSSPTTTSPLLFSHWENPVTYYLTGGELIATNGVNGSVYFGRDGVPKLYIGGGSAQATLRTNGLINDSRTEKDKNGSVIELKPNGHLEIGDKGFVLYRNAELRLSGGTFLAYDNAEIKSDTSKFSLTDGTTSHLAAAAGKTLTVSKVPTGTGTIVCQSGEGGTVLLKSGDWTNVTLGGKFTIQLTAAQRDSAVNTPLFKAAEGLTVSDITLQNPDGSVASGKGILLDGKFQYVATNAYVMPIRATINGSSTWSALGWTDSSAEPRSVPAAYLSAKGASVVAELTVGGESEITDTATVGTLTVTGSGAVKIPSGFTITTLKGDGKVVADGYMPSWGGVTANTWTGTVKFVVNNTSVTDLDFSVLGNAASTVEMAGTLTTGSYLKNTDCNIGTLALTGSMTLSNGYSANTYTFGKLEGDGSLTHSNTQTFKILFGDASGFTGTLSTSGAQIGIGSGATCAGKTIAIATAVSIATNRQWTAGSGINVQNGGELALAYPRTAQPTANAVTVNAGGALNIVCNDPATKTFQVTGTSAALTVNGQLKLNGEPLRKDAYTVSAGAVTLSGAAGSGASVSINVGGGGTGGVTGMLIDNANYAGVIPVKGANWNQDPLRTDGNAVDTTHSNLKEVLSDGSVITGPMKVRLLAKNVWSAKGHSTPTNGDAQMMFGYLDDGSCSTTGAGAGFFVDNIPYTTYDVYVYMGSDADSANPAFVAINVTDRAGTKTKAASWGDAATTHNTVTLTENSNYCRFTGCTGSSLKVVGAVKSNSLRGGIAAIQIFNTGTRLNTLTWNGGATGGTWDRTSANWRNSANADVAWTEVADGVNTAAFNGDTSLTLGEVVKPDVLNIASNNTSQTHAGFIPKDVGNKVKVATDISLFEVTSFAADMSGANVATKGAATPFVTSRSASEVAIQFRKADDVYVKCVKVTLIQEGNDIYAYANYAKYVSGKEKMDTDFDTTGSPGTVVTSDTAAGYGIKNLKLSIHSVGNLVVGDAEKFGKAFTVTNGILTVATGALTQDVTIASGAKLNIITTDVTNEYVVTSGKVVNGTYDNILVNGEAIDSASWTLDLDHGKLKRITKPGVPPFSYTISADSPTPVLWTNQQWLASNLFYVLPEEWTTGTVSEVKLTVDGNVTNTLVANANMAITLFKIANSGVVDVEVEKVGGGGQWNDAFLLNVGTLDDSASSGKTTLGFAPTNVMAGANTVISNAIAGKLTVNAGSKATINGTAGSYAVFSGGEVRYIGDTQITSAFASTEGATFAYKRAKLAMNGSEYWKLKLYDGDYVTATGSGYVNPIEVTGGELVMTNLNSKTVLLYGGLNVQGKSHSSIAVTGGKVTVLASGTGTANNNCGFLFGTTANGDTVPSITVDGGEFDISGGRFTFWERSTVTLANGGILKAKGVNKQAGGDSTLAINAGGILELGNLGLQKADGKSLAVTMNGGTLRAVDDAEEKLPIALTATNTFSAAANRTLTVSGLLSGSGAVVIGEEGYAGTVVLSNATALTTTIAIDYGTLAMPTNTIAANLVIGPNGKLDLRGLPGTSAPTEFAVTTGTITLEDGATLEGSVTVNGEALKASDKWEIEGGKIKRRIITPPFKFIITQNGNWNEQTWYDANNIVLRDYEVAEEAAKKPSITLEVQNESSLFITNELDLTSLAATGQRVTLDFTGYNGEELASKATFLHPATNVFIRTTSAISGNYEKAEPNLPAGYTGAFIDDATGLRYVITAPRKGYDYVAEIDGDELLGGIDFSEIEWVGGCEYTNNVENTVTLKVAGDVQLNLDETLEMYTFTLSRLDNERSAWVFLSSDGDFAAVTAGILRFDLGGADTVESPVDFGTRIVQMPTGFLQLSCDYSGPLKNGYAFCGKNNNITGGAFAGDRVSIAEGGTLSGDFSITEGGTVSIGGTCAGADSSFDVGSGILNIYGAVTLEAIAGGGQVLINYGGDLTADITDYAGTITLGDDESSYDTGTLRMTGTAAGPVNVSSNGTLRLTRTTAGQTAFEVTTDTLTFDKDHGAKLYVDDELIATSRITVSGGTIQVQDVIPSTPFTFTISQNGTYEWSKLAWMGANGVPVTPEYWEQPVASARLTAANGITATVNVDTNLNIGAFTMAGNTTLNMAEGSRLGTVAGSGTIACNFWPEGASAVGTLGEDWAGTFRITADSTEKKNWNFTPYYNGTNSTFAYSGTVSAGYFNQTNRADYGALDLTGSIEFNNGYSETADKSKVCVYAYEGLSGNGSIFFNKSGVTPVVWFKDISTFTGSLKTLASSYRLVVGDGEMTADASYPVKGGLTVVGDTTLTVGATINAPSGVLVTNATLTVAYAGNLKDAGPMTIGGAGKVVVHDGVLSNNVTIATGGTLDLQIAYLESANAFQITTGTLTNNGGTILVNNGPIPEGWHVVGNRLVKYATLFWIAQSGNWNDPNVWAHQDGSPAIFQDGDIVNFTNGVASVTLTADVAPYAIVVAEDANVTLNGNHSLGTPAITGAGTLAVNPGIGLELENFIPAACFAGFTGTYQVKSGRIKYASAIASAVTLKVTDGGQLWLAGGTWNNRFELSGHGRKSGANDVEYAALRLEGNQLGTSSSIEFIEEDGFITPGIGSTNGYTVPSVLSGCGMMVRGSGEMYLSVPKTQAAQIEGPVIINGCTVKFGDTWENDWDTQYKLGTSVEVKSGATLRLHLCQHGGTGVDDVDKSHFVTPVILDGGRLYDRDGSYCYDSVEVRSDSTFTAGDWGKRHIFKSLSGTGRLTVTSHNDSVLGILGGTFTGSIYNNGNGKVTPRNDALANATLELTSGGQLSLLDATQTIGKLMGGGKVYADQNATLTLKGGAYAGVIQNTSGGVGSTTLGLTIDGDVVLSGANTYTGLTTINEGAILSCVAAGGATVTFPGGIAGTGMLVAEGAGSLDLAGYRLNDGAGLMLANAGTIAFTLTTAETNGTAWVSFAKMVDDNIGNVELHNPDGSLNETFLIPQNINGVLMSKVKSDMPTPKYGYAFDGNLNAETGCTALSFGGESGDSYETSGHGQAYKFASGYTPYGGNFTKPTGGGWTIATFAKPVATENRVFWTLGDANDLFGLAVAPNRSVKVFKAKNNTAHTTLLTSAPIEDFSLEYHLFVMTYDGTTLKLYVDGVAQGEGYAGAVVFPNNQKFQFGSIHGGAGNTGVSLGADIRLDEWRVYSEVLTAEQLVTLANEFKPWRANAVEKGSILFIASSDDWDPAQLPTTAGKATASENISFAGKDAYLRQLVDGFDTVALITDATAGTYIYGLHAINGGTGLGAITRNVYLAMNAGTAYLISGGEDAAYNTDTKTIPTGNLLTQLGGSAIVDYAFGAGHKGGWNGITAEVKGDTGVTITDDAQVRGTVAGGWSSIHQAQPKVSGNTSVLVRNIQRLNTVSSSLYSNADNYLIGGSVFIGNGGGGVITGNTTVTVDIDDTQSGTFVKNIVGGSYYVGGHDMTIGGSSSVTVSAPKTVSFTGTFYAGSYGDSAHSTVAGTATMTLRNANFNAATLKGGNATGAKSLAASFDEDATFTPKAIDGFDTVKVSAKKSATVTLGKVFANQALTLESGHFELKDADPIALASLTLADAPTLTIAPNKEAAAIQVTNGSVDLNGATLALDPLYFRDIPEDDTSTYVLMSAPTIVTNGVQLGKGMWTLALEGTAGSGQTLKVTHGKGFYFIIAQDEWTEEKYVEHDDENTKQSLSIDTKWLVEKTELTEETVKDVDAVMDTLNETGDNGAKVFESYVLGLDPNDEASKPVPAPVQTKDSEHVMFKLDNVTVNPRSGAKNVTYNVWMGNEPGSEKEPAAQNIHYTDPVSVDLPASGVRYYHIEVMID